MKIKQQKGKYKEMVEERKRSEERGGKGGRE